MRSPIINGGMNNMDEWKEFEQELELTEEDQAVIKMEEDLIETLIAIREEQGLSQAQLAKKCNIKQPAIARMEKGRHSPQLDSLLKILVPLGYTLEIVPMK